MKICTIIGVRPQFVKVAVLSPIIRKEHTEILIHTGQHYDANMSAVFFQELGLPKPNYTLKPSDSASAEMENIPILADKLHLSNVDWLICNTDSKGIDSMVHQLISIIQRENVDVVLIYGDTNSTLAGALAAEQLKIPVIHVEAGERNGLVNNSEEQIRMRVDQLSSLLLCCSPQAMDNLRKEGLEERSHYIGNLMEVSFAKNIARPRVLWLQNLAYPAWQRTPVPPKYYLLTCHRQENANETNLTEILLAMEKANYPVIFPVHPRNKERVLKIYRKHNLHNVFLTEPVGYLDSIHLIKNAIAVITDSGGVLQEAHFAQTPYVFVLDIPCVPKNTRFDVSRLAKPERHDILAKLNTPQHFAADKNPKMQAVAQNMAVFEENVLKILREFGEMVVH